MIDKRPLVSVIIPCYNASEHLGEALHSVLRQSYTHLEIVVINDGSTDNTEEVVNSFSDNRIVYFCQENKGQCAASNLGIEKSTGDYVKFFDADDIMNEKHIELQLMRLNGSKNCIASCEWGRFYDGNPGSAVFKPEVVWRDLEPLQWLKASLQQKYDMMGAWIWLIPRPLLQTAGGWDERLSLNNDFEFSIRLLLHAQMVLFCAGAKIYYRSGMEGALSQVITEKRFHKALLSTELGCSYLLKAEYSSEMKRICANRYQEWLYRIYPLYPQLQTYLENKIQDLDGSDRKMDGGKVAQVLSYLFGWKTTKRIRQKLKELGYKKLPFN